MTTIAARHPTQRRSGMETDSIDLRMYLRASPTSVDVTSRSVRSSALRASTATRPVCPRRRRSATAPLAAGVRQRARVDDLEVPAGDGSEMVQVVVVPALARRARDVPVGAVVGHDHPVALQ